MRNRPVPDLLDRLVDREQRHEEPLARHNRISEAILDLNIEARGFKKAVDQVFEFGAGDVVEFIRSDDLDICHKEGRIEFGVGNPALHTAAGDADLVHDIAISGDDGVVRFTAQHIDRAAGCVAFGCLA